MTKILVAIANHGTGNRHYLERLLAEYRTVPAQVDVVVLSNIPKDLGPGVEVRVGVPTSNPWSLPFAHRPLFAERAADYDLFIYSEDDTLVTARNIAAFEEAERVLAADEVAGFVRYEQDAAGQRYCSTMHTCFRWDLGSLRRRGADVFARYTNEHAACYMLTRQKLQHCIESGGFLVEPYEGRHDMLCAAATDPYTRCGLTKLVCVNRIEDFLLAHLPNKYIGRMGLALPELQRHTTRLLELSSGNGWRGPAFEPESRMPRSRWSKNLYGPPDSLALELAPRSGVVLSLGAGTGETEAALRSAGCRVAAVPVDPVFAASLAARGIEIIDGGFEGGGRWLGSNPTAVLLISHVLHLLPQPRETLERLLAPLAPGAAVIVSTPNLGDPLLGWTLRPELMQGLRSFESGGVQRINLGRLRAWLRACGFGVEDVRAAYSGRRARWAPAARLLGRTLGASEFAVRARRTRAGSDPS